MFPCVAVTSVVFLCVAVTDLVLLYVAVTGFSVSMCYSDSFKFSSVLQ